MKAIVRLVQERNSPSARWPPCPGSSDNTGKIYSDPIGSELETLGNVSLRGTALDRALPLASDGSGFLQVIGQVGDTTHELPMVASALGAFRNEVRDRAATPRVRRDREFDSCGANRPVPP